MELHEAARKANTAANLSQTMQQSLSKAIVMLGATKENQIIQGDTNRDKKIEEMNQIYLEIDGYLTEYFQQAVELETALSTINQVVHRHAHPSVVSITNFISPSIDQNSPEYKKMRIKKLLEEISTMDKVIQDNDKLIQKQTNILGSVLQQVDQVHEFNDIFNVSLLTLSPASENLDEKK